jgi:hypothetical protein
MDGEVIDVKVNDWKLKLQEMQYPLLSTIQFSIALWESETRPGKDRPLCFAPL